MLAAAAAGGRLAAPGKLGATPEDGAPITRDESEEGAVEVTRDGLDTTVGPGDWFTGAVYIDAVAAPIAGTRLTASRVHFTPGARTAWHTHPNGQTIYVLEGVGLAQRRGGPIEVIRPGDRVFFEPGEEHWHGATATRFMAHLAMLETDDEGTSAPGATTSRRRSTGPRRRAPRAENGFRLRLDDDRYLVDVAPGPVLARLGGARDRVTGLARVPAGVAVRRGVAAADRPAVRHMRRCTHRLPIFRHSSQPGILSGSSVRWIWSRCVHVVVMLLLPVGRSGRPNERTSDLHPASVACGPRHPARAPRIVVGREHREERMEPAALLRVERCEEVLLDPLDDHAELGELLLARCSQAHDVPSAVGRVAAALDQLLRLELVEQPHQMTPVVAQGVGDRRLGLAQSPRRGVRAPRSAAG